MQFLRFFLIKFIQARIELGFQAGNLFLVVPFGPVQAHHQLALVALNGAAARILVDIGDNVLCKIEHALQMAGADVEQQP